MSAIIDRYAARLAPLALVAAAACSAPFAGPEGEVAPDADAPATDAATPAVDAGADAADAADAGPVIVATYGKGRVTVDADGVTLDATLGINCAFSKASDGVARCLPAQSGVAPVGFTSVDCTGVVVSAPAGTTRVYFVDGADVCQSNVPYEASAVLTAGDAGACTEQSSLPAGLYFKCSSVITASQFVAQTEADQ